ncbi:hypothetical protein Micbo1qcDRAFT_167591, partial [Microdochium bolleyi]
MAERSAQVAMMRQIYQGARRVISWLGHAQAPKTEDVLALKELVRAIGQLDDDDEPSRAIERTRGSQLWRLTPRTKSTPVDEVIGSLTTLFEDMRTSEYWRRAWIRQEVTSGRDVVLWHGHTEMLIADWMRVRDWVLALTALPKPAFFTPVEWQQLYL